MNVYDLYPFEYEIEETDEPVSDEIDFESRFRFRAEKWCARMNAQREVPFYRYEVFRDENKWVVVAMQNVLARKREDGTPTASEDRPDEAS